MNDNTEIDKLKDLLRQLIKFGIVGVLATIIDFITLFILTDVFHVYYLTSAAMGFFMSTLFNYAASMRFVFKSRYGQDERRKELFIFMSLSIFGLGLNQFLMWLFVDEFQLFYMVAKMVATVFVMGWNFISRKIWIEK